MKDIFVVPDGLIELRQEIPAVVEMIANTARWVHPDTFRALPVWYPETARRQPIYDSKWSRVYKNTSRLTNLETDKSEPNIKAKKAFVSALGAGKTANWTVCHIWGIDDPKFQHTNNVVCDNRFYSCVGNMVWLPTPLKGFTDAVPMVKCMLRTCSFYLYDWVCEHNSVSEAAAEVRSGFIPDGYPTAWPSPGRKVLPPGTAPFTARVAGAISRRKEQLRRMLNDDSLTKFPREEVRRVLEFWKVQL